MSEADIFRRLTASTGQQPVQDDTDKILDGDTTNPYAAPHPLSPQNQVATGGNITAQGHPTRVATPEAFDAEEEAKKQQGLPYSMKAYRNGKVVRGSMWGG